MGKRGTSTTWHALQLWPPLGTEEVRCPVDQRYSEPHTTGCRAKAVLYARGIMVGGSVSQLYDCERGHRFAISRTATNARWTTVPKVKAEW